MSGHDSQDMQTIHVHFRADDTNESAEWGRAGWTALEQAEAELDRSGVAVSLEPEAPDGAEATRGFGLDDVLVNVAANAITMLLFRAVTELIYRVRQVRAQRHPSAPPAAPASQPGPQPAVVLRAGDEQLAIGLEASDEEITQRLASWAPHVLATGNLTVQLRDTPPDGPAD